MGRELTVLKDILTGVFVVAALAVIAVVLLQSGRSSGLSGPIAGGAETIFGKKKGLDDLFSRWTIYLGVVFGALALALVSLK